jgi:hypothetical protein
MDPMHISNTLFAVFIAICAVFVIGSLFILLVPDIFPNKSHHIFDYKIFKYIVAAFALAVVVLIVISTLHRVWKFDNITKGFSLKDAKDAINKLKSEKSFDIQKEPHIDHDPSNNSKQQLENSPSQKELDAYYQQQMAVLNKRQSENLPSQTELDAFKFTPYVW